MTEKRVVLSLNITKRFRSHTINGITAAFVKAEFGADLNEEALFLFLAIFRPLAIAQRGGDDRSIQKAIVLARTKVERFLEQAYSESFNSGQDAHLIPSGSISDQTSVETSGFDCGFDDF